ncbi:MAG: hypothetical protein JNL88_00065 [Bacteroidia bacterium]|nr:hypothetical protein [Bacteroidia bacterium]
MKTNYFLPFLLLAMLVLSSLTAKAQMPVDAYVTTSAPVNDMVEGTGFITLADTNQVDLIELKLGSGDGLYDLFNYSFVFDQSSGLPTGCDWNRVGSKVILKLGSFPFSDVQFGMVRIKYHNGIYSDIYSFVTN